METSQRKWKVRIVRNLLRRYQFQAWSDNGKLVFASKGYWNHKDCLDTVLSMKEHLGNATVIPFRMRG